MLVVVDDAHWLDDASAAALLFTARRLQGDAVAMLFAVRDEESERFDSRDLPVLTVTGVDDAAAGDLISEHVQTPVAPEVRAELLAATRGNPLGLVELTRALSADQLSGRDRLPHRLPLTKGVEARVPGPVPQTPRTGADTAAGCCRPTTPDAPRPSSGQQAPSAPTPTPWTPPRASGLLEVTDGTLALRHPLVRSAIYGAATSARRRQAHRALADALAGTPDEDRRAWHLAASVDEPDEEVVDGPRPAPPNEPAAAGGTRRLRPHGPARPSSPWTLRHARCGCTPPPAPAWWRHARPRPTSWHGQL